MSFRLIGRQFEGYGGIYFLSEVNLGNYQPRRFSFFFFFDWRLFVKYILQSELGAMGEVLGVCGAQHTTAWGFSLLFEKELSVWGKYLSGYRNIAFI